MTSTAWEQLHHEALLEALSGEGFCDMCLGKERKNEFFGLENTFVWDWLVPFGKMSLLLT